MAVDPNNLAGTAQLTFSDEFDSLRLWNGSTGVWSTTFWTSDMDGAWATSNGGTLEGNDELQWYINANWGPTAAIDPWSVSGGVLSLTASRAAASLQPQINGYDYVSGMVNTWHSFVQQYGYFEINAKMPAGQGFWPAFWLMQQDGDWPPELDVVEFLGSDVDTGHSTLHTMQTGDHTQQSATYGGVDLTAGFHRYGVNWQADYVTFYFDGREVGRFATPSDLHEPMYAILNLAVGGWWPGDPNASTPFPSSFEIDYVRVYGDVGITYLNGAQGADRIIGGPGDDMISGVDGEDYLRGGDGDDYIFGGDGFDDVHGNAGNDTVRGGLEHDWVVGGKGDDLLFGEQDDDIVYGNLGRDTLYGGYGQDTVRGGQEDDVLYGDDGDDWMSGDRGFDRLWGGEGADTFHVSADTGVERIEDFSQAEGDRIQIDAGLAYTTSQSGADAVINLEGGGQVVLVGVQLASLQNGWIFAV